MAAPLIKLNNGYDMPVFGLGTYTSRRGECVKAVKAAIDAGYRHIDTAYLYGNEAEVGQAIKEKISEGIVKRSDVFVVTKFWSQYHKPNIVEHMCRNSLDKLGLGYIDLYLIHFPVGFKAGSTSEIDYVDTWKDMEKLVKLGLVRSIGVSNFNSEQIERLLSLAEIKPVTNQVECSLFLNQKKLTKFCKDRDIIITAYSPLAKGYASFLSDPKVQEIAQRYNKTTAQVAFRYLIELGTIPIPKSVTKERIVQNIDIFDFKLTESDLKILDTFNTGERAVDWSHLKNTRNWPFRPEY